MGKLWNFLNSPLIVVLVALSIWPILLALTSAYSMKIGIQEMAGAIGSEVVAPFKKMGQQQDEKLKKELKIIDEYTLSNSFNTLYRELCQKENENEKKWKLNSSRSIHHFFSEGVYGRSIVFLLYFVYCIC